MCKKDEEIEQLKAERDKLLIQLQEKDREIRNLKEQINSNFTYETEGNCPSEETIIAQADFYAQFGY